MSWEIFLKQVSEHDTSFYNSVKKNILAWTKQKDLAFEKLVNNN